MIHTADLAQAIEELHEVNQQLIEAAKPMDRLSEMDSQQRRQLAAQLRAGLARWEVVTQRIDKILHEGSVSGSHEPPI